MLRHHQLARDWLKTFDLETKPKGAVKRALPKRILLVDARFPVDPKFEMACWDAGIICLCLPKKSYETLHPLDPIFFNQLSASYGRHMERRLRSSHSASVAVDQVIFAQLVKRQPRYYTEELAEAVWKKSCLFPTDEARLRDHIGEEAVDLTDEDGINVMRQI